MCARAAGGVQPLAVPPRVTLTREPPPPVPVQLKLDERRVLQEALSYRRPGLGPDVVRKLRRGGWRLQGQIDLHGLRREDARQALADFIREANKQGWRCVRVVHGKGLGSPGKTPVLKGRVQSWLAQKKEVLAFVQARPAEGGAGALVVLLAPTAQPSAT